MRKRQQTNAPKNVFSTSQQADKERGASMVENALVVAFIFAVAVGAVRVTGRTVSQQFSTVQGQMSPSNACSCPTQVAYVTSVYQQVLRREPDPGGLSFWVGQINGGTTREEFLQIACSCPEYNALVNSSGTQSQACTTGGAITCSCS